MQENDSELISNAIHHKHQGNYNEAFDLYDRAINLKGPELHRAYYNKGVLLEQFNKKQEAIECYEMATQLEPTYFHAWHDWGNLLCSFDEYGKAKEKFENAHKAAPNELYPKYGIAYTLNRLNGFQEALTLLDSLFDEVQGLDIDDKFYSLINRELGFALMNTNHIQDAYDHFNLALELNDKDYHSCYNIGFISDMFKEYDEALLFYERAIELDPKEAQAYQGKACTYIHTKKYKEALEFILEAIRLNPTNYQGYYNLACVYAGLGLEKETMDTIKKTIAMAPKQIGIENFILRDPDFSNFASKIAEMLSQ
ncbi:tetratricopeptide repeat protein [Flagellimonas aequoris]|uniref:Tetratricopeptide repeat protein n=1 Tax=Flagellimonas aequoris TaxID=2306997 RepID=A0A418N9R2_9FLAO|nr:tetratricopeptide repeat protein [Allomuricauda aequoris]RIV71979.1 tetratricopeptide repeat protein [Allomuricauda aequoris]TXK03746.1 tetratricopeptide repeat protein [Allomuricauda aequoris]